MASLIDRMRTGGVSTREIAVLGVDPDGDTTGIALVTASLSFPPSGPAAIQQARLYLCCGQGRDLDGVVVMINELYTTIGGAVGRATRPVDALFVEAQQVYPTPNQDPRERVAKANDLLRLAQVTGAAQAYGRVANIPVVQAVLPATWKGQQKKAHTLATVQQRFESATLTVADDPVCGLAALPRKYGHAIDAAGIALYGIDYLHRHGHMLPALT